MDYKLEVVVVPVSDVDRAKRFYGEQCGFNVDLDDTNGGMRIVQLTPPGSACSVTIGTGITTSQPGSYQGLQLVVTDIEAASRRAHRAGRGCWADPPLRGRRVARGQGRAVELVRELRRPRRERLAPAGDAEPVARTRGRASGSTALQG